MRTAKALLLDTGFSARPILDSLAQSGIDVTVVGRGGTTLVDSSSGRYVDCDYANVAAVGRLAADVGVDYLVPGVTDVAYHTCAQLAQAHALTGVDTPANTITLNDKLKFRELCQALSLPAPRILNPQAAAQACGCIVKPADSYSGRGVTTLRGSDPAALSRAISLAKAASVSGSYLVEEFVAGQLYSHSCFLRGGRIGLDFFVEEHSVANPYAVDTSFVVGDFDEEKLRQVRDCVEKIAAALELVDGLFHTQFISNEDGISLIEVTQRCPGDLYSLLIEHATGFPYAAAYTAGFIDEQIPVGPVGQPAAPYIIRHTVRVPPQAPYRRIEFMRPVKIIEMVPVVAVQPGHPHGLAHGRVAVLFTASSSEQEHAETLHAALEGSLYRAS